MTNKLDIQKLQKIYFSYPNTIALIVTKVENIVNVMPAVWNIPLSYDPPLFGVLISPKRYTYGLLLESRNFSANFLDFSFCELIANLGQVSGKDVNKIKKFNIKLEKSRYINSPIMKVAYISFECKLVETQKLGDHDLFVGSIVNVRYRKDVFTETGSPDISKISPALYLGNLAFTTTKDETKIFRKLTNEANKGV